jgi:Dyp-type peroxidase family
VAPPAVRASLELDDIQGLVARGYGNLPVATFVLVAIPRGAAPGKWLEQLAADVTPATDKPGGRAVHVAFTAGGLARLGLDPAASGFSPEFVGGMTTPHRRRLLGDQGSNAPEGWDWGGPGTPGVDAVLLLYAAGEAELDSVRHQQAARLATGGLREIAALPTRGLDAYEHFGFHDGISQPIVEGLSRKGAWADTIRAGEFVLGYPNEYGLYTEGPVVEAAADAGGILPKARANGGAGGMRDLGRNGTYLVLRQLAQHVHTFWQFAAREAENHNESHFDSAGAADGPATARTRVAAKMVGRWPEGAPLVMSPGRDDPHLSGANDFAYHASDPFGDRCPIGAHVRRANPRDSLDPDPGSRKSVAINKRHRILRRGRGYGPRITVEGALQGSDESDDPRGLHFLCLNANIARQFEFIQHSWVNDPKFSGLYDDPDPLVGARTDPRNDITVQARPVRTRLQGMPEFTSVRGGAYFFLPGVRALRYLATLGSSSS